MGVSRPYTVETIINLPGRSVRCIHLYMETLSSSSTKLLLRISAELNDVVIDAVLTGELLYMCLANCFHGLDVTNNVRPTAVLMALVFAKC